MRTYRNLIKILIACSLIFLGTSFAAGEVGVTDTSIKVGSHMDLSGVIAYWGNNLRMGMQSHFKDVNAQGGVHGRKVDFIVEDDQYKPPLSIAAAKKLISKDKIFAFVGPMGAQQAGATMKLAIDRNIPFICPMSDAAIFYKPLKRQVFALFMPYYDQGAVMVDYAIETLNAKKIGVIYQEDDVGLGGKNGAEAQLKKYKKKLGISVPFKRGTKDFSSQVLKLRESGVDLVIIASIIAEPAAIIKEAAKLGWKPQFMCQSSTGTNPYFIKMAGPACEGTIVATQALLPDSSKPGVVKYREVLKAHFPDAKPEFMNQVGYMVAVVFTEALRIVGRDLTREKLIEGMEKIKDFDAGMYPPITFSSTNHLGTDACFLAKVEGEKFVKVTDYLRPK